MSSAIMAHQQQPAHAGHSVDESNAGSDAVPELRFPATLFPVSAAFASFVDQATGNRILPHDDVDWGDQITERMRQTPRSMSDFVAKTRAAATQAFHTDIGRHLTVKAYTIFGHLLTGNTTFSGQLHTHDRFMLVVSAPRHGGSYLTKELYRAVGMDHRQLPATFAHDGYPDASLRWTKQDFGQNLPMPKRTIQQTAEWLTMADWFFREAPKREGLRTIPKKATKMIYAAPFFREVFGPSAEWVVAVRHPAAACLSLVEKAGGMTNDGKFPQFPRSAIEQYVLSSWADDGISAQDVARMDYFTAYLHYWMRYHQIMAVNGLFSGNKRLRVLAYHPDQFESYLQEQHIRFGSGQQVEPMHVHSKTMQEVPHWVAQSQKALDGVAALWESYQVAFPMEAIAIAL